MSSCMIGLAESVITNYCNTQRSFFCALAHRWFRPEFRPRAKQSETKKG
jgi:hypothetical protein